MQQPKGFYLQQYMLKKKEAQQAQQKVNMSIEEADACIQTQVPTQEVKQPVKIEQTCSQVSTVIEETKQQQQQPQIILPDKKIKKIKRQWKPEYVLTWFSDLMPINGKVVTKYKYSIQIKYLESKEGKEKQISLKIGNKNMKYRVDGATEEEARLINSRLQKYQTPFDKGYWVIQYLNRDQNKYLARAQFMDFIQNKN